MAGGAALWRGYEYWREGRVLVYTRVGRGRWSGVVTGVSGARHNVFLDLDNPRSSHCDCGIVGREDICKHMAAMFFAVSPHEADSYGRWVRDFEWEEARRQEELARRVELRLQRMDAAELRAVLIQHLFDGPEWQFDRFVSEYIDPSTQKKEQ